MEDRAATDALQSASCDDDSNRKRIADRAGKKELSAMSLPRRALLAASCATAVALLHGCAVAPSAAAARVQDADTSMVASCKYLSEVQGSSGWGNLAASAGMENAKTEARENAAKLGATHILWNNIAGGFAPYVSGKAYKC